MIPTLFTSCNVLPSEGATASMAGQSRFRGPYWKNTLNINQLRRKSS